MAPRYCHSYLYDVENDKFEPFIKNYNQDINKKFNISHVLSADSMSGHSFVIDNDNHILYWLQSSHWQRSLLSIDIKNLKDIKFIDQTLLPLSIDGIRFSSSGYTMVVVYNKIQFILGRGSVTAADDDSLRHFQFDTKTKRLSLIHKSIHLKSSVHANDANVKKLKLDDLKTGDCVDVKSDAGTYWFLARVEDIKDIENVPLVIMVAIVARIITQNQNRYR